MSRRTGFRWCASSSGHGIGTKLHEEPQIPNYGTAGRGPRLAEGMVLAIEPMVNVGQAGGEGARRRVDGGDEGRQPVGALRAHGGGDRRRVPRADAARRGGRGRDRAAAGPSRGDDERVTSSGRSAEGVVLELLPSQLVRVELEGRHHVTAHLASPVRPELRPGVVGDRVRVALMANDPRGRDRREVVVRR